MEICVANEAVPAHLANNSEDYVGHCAYAREANYEALGENVLKCIPNPFSTFTDIQFSVLQSGDVVMKLYDYLGQQIKVLYNGNVESGTSYSVKFDGSELAAGLYFCTLTGDGINETRKMQLMK